MTTINVSQFEGYDFEDFKSFLEAGNPTEFEIIIPKETVLFYTSNNEISREFATAAYIGQKLFEISTKFSYKAASLADPSEFKFIIGTIKIDDLAELLAEISSVFGNSEIVEPINFVSEVSTFAEKFKNKKVRCQDLFDIAHEYHSDEEM